MVTPYTVPVKGSSLGQIATSRHARRASLQMKVATGDGGDQYEKQEVERPWQVFARLILGREGERQIMAVTPACTACNAVPQ